MEWIVGFLFVNLLVFTWRVRYLKLGPLVIEFWPNRAHFQTQSDPAKSPEIED